ncbi:MAG: hypothetical protein QW835_05705 [Candidatus Hadarchaeum sp.]
MAFLPKKRPRKPPEEKLKVRVVYRPPKGPVEFGKPKTKPEMPQAQPAEKVPKETFKVTTEAKRAIVEHMETPVKKGVWKTLPTAQKILTVVIPAAIIVPIFVFVIYPSIVPLLTPERDLTGTWRDSISGRGLIYWAGHTSPGAFVSDNPEDPTVDLAIYCTVEWKVTQSGDTIAGPMTIKVVKIGGTNPLWAALQGIAVGNTYVNYVTGIVEGTKITLTESPEGYSGIWPAGSGTFTSDMMTITKSVPAEAYEDSGVVTFVPSVRNKLSLKRVW